MAGKLSDEHLEEICRRAACGEGPTLIARFLAAGIETGSGVTLHPVVVDESAVRYHIKTRADRVNAWREKLYGSVLLDPMGWPGYRMQQIRSIHDKALKDGDGRLALKCVTDARAEATMLAPRVSTQHAHLHLHGDDRPSLVAVLGAKLSELARAGLLEDAAELLGAPELDAGAIEATTNDAP